MLHPFVSARDSHAAERAVGGLTASVAAHAGMVGLALIANAAPVMPTHPATSIGVEHVVFTGIAPSDPLRIAHASSAAARRARHTAPHSRGRAHEAEALHVPDAALDFLVAALASMVDEIQIELAHFDAAELAATASEGIAFDRAMLREFSGAPKPYARRADGAFVEADVEKVVAPFGTNPRPRYPSSLQASNVEGTFVVEFVVDSTGRVDRRTFEFPPATHRLFVKAVRDALLRSRFLPAELGGRRVAQMVQQRFSFILHRD